MKKSQRMSDEENNNGVALNRGISKMAYGVAISEETMK